MDEPAKPEAIGEGSQNDAPLYTWADWFHGLFYDVRDWLYSAYFIGGAVCGGLAGLAVFAGGWFYAVATWGWFLGLAFGWVPAGIIAIMAAVVVGFGWPLVVPCAAILGWQLYNGGPLPFEISLRQ